jgi:oligosaccharyltransferase complex subunit gamma
MWGTVVFFALSGVLSLRFLAPILSNRWVWAVITVLTSLVMTSGYMFTRIRGMPSAAPDGSWIASGFQSQYGQETTVVATLCT